ncbi:hypothetical protein [Streptomyces sp. CA-106131]|uniref:hypothetical protein n=1 Tax=Streptomyces sp. CA-106131 TaxID=3240045 RepID=UPI003D945CBF
MRQDIGDWERVTTDLLQLVRSGDCNALSLGLSEIARALVCTGPHSHVRVYDAATDDFITGFLRGCAGLQAGEESDSCGAGQGQPDRRQGDPASTPHGRDAAHNGQELSTVSPPR